MFHSRPTNKIGGRYDWGKHAEQCSMVPPTLHRRWVRHGADLGYIPIVVTDAYGAGHAEAGERSLASIKFMGDAILTDIQTIRGILGRTTKA
jgi:hypothetical protein